MSSTYNYKFVLKPSKDDSLDRMFCFYDYEKILRTIENLNIDSII